MFQNQVVVELSFRHIFWEPEDGVTEIGPANHQKCLCKTVWDRGGGYEWVRVWVSKQLGWNNTLSPKRGF